MTKEEAYKKLDEIKELILSIIHAEDHSKFGITAITRNETLIDLSLKEAFHLGRELKDD